MGVQHTLQPSDKVGDELKEIIGGHGPDSGLH